MNEDKLIAIETALAHQEQHVQDLVDVIHKQWKDIEMLKAKVEYLASKLKAVEAQAPSSTEGLSVAEIAAAEKPPHY